ncbi:Lrp/AsnC family transcriptional regulator [Bombella sp. TMW 2.2543]|uniref:Lrp/AsnC family transcriptional regulator n=1 Tax=Bombella pluederhausensis TaxID=2967336 RepID=A0ABT3WJ86_9PROT|nr:Lrp/AsnC family transcriptional regulator [Bombella pluederhausensis]MCX5617867.1 Lrp/AsnC family transcriptional regulator [Bombella pluederhausensis]
MSIADLDDIDRSILSELQQDGRVTNVELARRVGISAPPCLRRVRRLEEMGLIQGYHAILAPAMLGWSISFYVLVGLDSQKGKVLEEFEAHVAEWPETRECHMIRGGEDFLLHLMARDVEHQNRLTRDLIEVNHVVRVQTFQVIRTSCERAGVPL